MLYFAFYNRFKMFYPTKGEILTGTIQFNLCNIYGQDLSLKILINS